MTKHPSCADECQISAARGPTHGCHGGCAYAEPIITSHDMPPIPVRIYDWSAVREGYEPGALIGRGKTEAAAVADLMEQENDQQEEG